MTDFNFKQLQSEMVKPISEEDFETFEKWYFTDNPNIPIHMPLDVIKKSYYGYLELVNNYEKGLDDDFNAYEFNCMECLMAMCLWKHYDELEYLKGGD